jgi:hypothetical protein
LADRRVHLRQPSVGGIPADTNCFGCCSLAPLRLPKTLSGVKGAPVPADKFSEALATNVIPISENYEEYRPPAYAYPTIAKLLSSLPDRYLSGLRSVVLTNRKQIGKGKTGRIKGKKHPRYQCLGFYHPEKNGEPPWIELIVDNIIAACFVPGKTHFLIHIPVARKLAFADTLFHEVGHHLDCTIGAPARGGEAAAEAWKKRLLSSYFRRRYWYLAPFMRIAKALVKLMMNRKAA